ncbi:imidazolonepropionase [Legionella impletisoli]|uniref:Imidazolonepropionase n=2 Tax=Bacteria TaxID=2 RepID=A0A917NDS5_9GAMM|nr:imidazolonepropionase [Legionella impletisoli]GGI92940.1 imidazolonepropionase [Legionella impletisoli]
MALCNLILTHATIIDHEGKQYQNYSLAINDEIIAWCGPHNELPQAFYQDAVRVEDCAGRLITPGLIDCHTHLVYAGNRANEFRKRLNGISYAEIAKAGGGILSTVQQTRDASEDLLLEQSLPRLRALQSEGVLTVEIKSGYGLDLETELKMLRVARKLGEITGVRVKTTFLGAHAIPNDFKGRSQAYIDYLCQEMLPAVANEGLADAVDVFCESIGFSLKETEQVFKAARDLSLPVKCHAEQLSNLGASSLAASFGALSSDHLEYLDQNAIRAMASSGTVAVLLPGAFYCLNETRKPPIAQLRKEGLGMAIATDCNPGSSPITSILLVMNMGCQLFSLTVPEVWSGVTYQAARALGIAEKVGSLKAGMRAELLRWPVTDAAELCYQIGFPYHPECFIQGNWKSLRHEE